MLVKLVENVWDGKKIHKPSVQSPSQKHCRRETSIFHTVEWMEEPQFLAFKTKQHQVEIKDDNKKMCVVALDCCLPVARTPLTCDMRRRHCTRMMISQAVVLVEFN